MKRHYMAAAIIATVNIAIYPFAQHAATVQRGHPAIGGEDMLLLFGFCMSVLIITSGIDKARRSKEERRMPFYKQCPACGSNNDPEERCECQQKRDEPPEGRASAPKVIRAHNDLDAPAAYHRQRAPVNSGRDGGVL